jgi:hypothetical protein
MKQSDSEGEKDDDEAYDEVDNLFSQEKV